MSVAMQQSNTNSSNLPQKRKYTKKSQKISFTAPVNEGIDDITKMMDTISIDHSNAIKNLIEQESINNTENNNNEVLEHLHPYIEEPYKIIESYFQGKHLERLILQ